MKITINDYLKSFLDILIILITLFKSKIKNIFTPLRISFENKKNKECIILGNGPSLNNDIEHLNNIDHVSDLFVVNYFARSEFFHTLKPSQYFFSDKMFWSNELLDKVKYDNEFVFEILQSVDWKINILCPVEGFNYINKKLSKNQNLSIKIIPIRYSNLLLKESTYYAIKNRYFSIPNVNSVITLLWMSIFMNYNKITLYGCDFSAFKDIMVDQKTNEIIVSTKHFYGNSFAEKNAGKKYVEQKDKPLSVRIFQVYRCFNLLDILAEISKDLNIEVINGSSFSFIDSFPRSQ